MEALDPVQHVYMVLINFYSVHVHGWYIFTSAPYTACTGQYMSLQASSMSNSL